MSWLHVCRIAHCGRWWLIPGRRRFLEGWFAILAHSLVVVETDSWFAHPTALWTDEDEDDWDATRSFCLLHFSVVASCLSASNLHLAFLTDGGQLSRNEASCCHDWWLIPDCGSSSIIIECLFSLFFLPSLYIPFMHLQTLVTLRFENSFLSLSHCRRFFHSNFCIPGLW